MGTWRTLPAVLLLAALIVGCDIDADFTETLVKTQAERNQQRFLEQQRQELPLPDPDVVEYKSYSASDVAPDGDFDVGLVDDLVLGDGRTDPEYQFVRFDGGAAALGNVAVDSAGRFFVLETRSGQVRVFDREGGFLHQFGQPGEGPGDFQRPYGLAVAGDRVSVFHRAYRSSIWTLDGHYVRDRETLRTPEALEAIRLLGETDGTLSPSPAEARRRSEARRLRAPVQVMGNPDTSMLMVLRATPTERRGRISTPRVRVLGRFVEGEETRRYLEVPEWATPSFVVSVQGDMYVSMFGHLRTERYILALDPEGEPRFVIVTPWDAKMPPRADLRVDGQGRLYALPNFRAPEEQTHSPVEVFTRDGELLGSGKINRRPMWTHWQVTTSDHVYGVRVNPETDEWEVVRYRLEIDAQ